MAYEFWYFGGVVYGLSKYTDHQQYSNFVTTRPVVEFFIKRQESGDTHIKLYGYDLAIANGQKVAMIAAKSTKKDKSRYVCYCNVDLRINTTLSDEVKEIKKAEMGWFGSDDSKFDSGLKEFISKIRI